MKNQKSTSNWEEWGLEKGFAHFPTFFSYILYLHNETKKKNDSLVQVFLHSTMKTSSKVYNNLTLYSMSADI